MKSMSLAGGRGAKDAVDLQLKHFIEAAAANQRFQSLVHELTDTCWETCIDKPSARLETKNKTCLVNCVERFIDTTNFITNRLQKISLSPESSNNWE